MNVYDFDKTIYQRDSTVDFYRFCLHKKPGLLRYLPRQLAAGAGYFFRRLDKTAAKEDFYCFLRGLDDTGAMVDAFWQAHETGIKPWYIRAHRPDDVVVSASPEFLLAPICKKLGVRRLIASRVDPRTGRYTGANCHGKEKVARFRHAYPREKVDRFYSDSLSDRPLSLLARERYIVRGERLIAWEDYEKGTEK